MVKARVTLVAAADGRTITADPSLDAGSFAFDEVGAGRWTIRVEAPGYVAQAAELVIPHRGEWSALEVRLESLRDRAVEQYRAVALEVLPSSRLWAVLTNREVLVRARETALRTVSTDNSDPSSGTSRWRYMGCLLRLFGCSEAPLSTGDRR